ncbi:MAG: serine hydrolase, partial [Candidatus Aenigmarchaeota archaeon]|nr:serine hydrolase [Candidatus Aenigmarchaeota archaeon]
MSEPAEPIAQEKPKAAGSGGFFISRRTAVLLACTYLVLIGAVAYVLLQNTHLESSLDSGFDLLSARVAWLGANQFVQAQKAMIITYAPMKQALLNYRTANGIADRYSIYYEDLTTGASVGIDEKNTFVPASLLKMPTVVAILKKVEIGSLSLDDTVTLAPDMIDTESGDLAGMGAGYVITVRQLLNYTTAKSDNTALWALDSLLTIQEYTDARAAIGLPYTSRMNDTIVSP